MQIATKTRQLNTLDDEICRKLTAVTHALRARCPIDHPVDVPFPPWGKLGWSGRRGRLWRLVVVDDEVCEDLAAMPRECRADACFVLGKLVEHLGVARLGHV